MTSVQIKNVPDETLAVLKRRAESSHQSLQEYLLAGLIAQANSSTIEEVMARVSRRRPAAISVADATAAVRAIRDSR